jgi:hypothetical protein
LGQYLGEKTSIGKKKIEIFIQELYRYGVVGLQRKEDKTINFKYTSKVPLILEKIKDYLFFLHRGLWWFAQKRNARTIRGLKPYKEELEESLEIIEK